MRDVRLEGVIVLILCTMTHGMNMSPFGVGVNATPGMLGSGASTAVDIEISSSVGGKVVTSEGRGLRSGGKALFIEARPTDSQLFAFSHWSGSLVDAGNVVDPYNPKIQVENEVHGTLHACFIAHSGTIYVQGGKADSGTGDELELGTRGSPIYSIQGAVDVARQGAVVIVGAGIYRETVQFGGKQITLMGYDPNAVADCSKSGRAKIHAMDGRPAVEFVNEEDFHTSLVGFEIWGDHALEDDASAILCVNSSPVVSHCMIVGYGGSAAIRCTDSNAEFVNCTIADNLSCGIDLKNSNVFIENSIFWNNQQGDIRLDKASHPHIDYCTISDESHTWGDGNSLQNPLFVRAGRWDTILEQTFFTRGDYHLQSEAGRWDPIKQDWVVDGASSPGIDSGNPLSSVADEPIPHGERVNMGAYGGTCLASKTLDVSPFVHIPDPLLKVAIEDALWITDPTPSDMLELVELKCTNSYQYGVEDLTGLEHAANLRTLILSYNAITDLRPLSNLKNLKKLVFNHNLVSDLSPLSKITSLQHLDMHRNKFGNNFEALYSLKRLSTLVIRENQITDIAPVYHLPQLSELDISENSIDDLSILSGLSRLKELDLSNNHSLSDISPLSDLSSLRVLQLNLCNISSVEPLTHLTNLDELDLDKNDLDDDSYCYHLHSIAGNNSGLDLDYSPNVKPPDYVSASQGTVAGGVEVSWGEVCNGPIYTTYYCVSRALTENDSPQPISGWEPSLSFFDSSAVPGTHYTYWVQSATSSQGLKASGYSDSCTGWE